MVTLTPITALPPAPSRSDDQETFVAKADAFVAALNSMVDQVNQALAAIPVIAQAVNYNTTSSSSLTIGTGSKTFMALPGGIQQVGQYIIAASGADVTKWMAGQITSYNATTGQLVVNVTAVNGAGTFADWVISITPPGNIGTLSTVSFTGSGNDILTNSMPLTKLVNATGASMLIGRISGSGAGAWSQITLGANLSMSAGGVLSVSSGTATLGAGDYGDITVGAGGTTMTVDAGAITYSKIQNMTANTILGAAVAGPPVEITCTQAGRDLLAGADVTAQRATLGLGSSALIANATVAEYRNNTAGLALNTDIVWSAQAFVALTQATTIAVDLSTGINFTTTMTGNRTLGAPSNAKVGQSGVIEIIQDATGSRTLAYNAVWMFAGGTDPVLTTTANAKDYLSYVVISPTFILASLVKDAK